MGYLVQVADGIGDEDVLDLGVVPGGVFLSRLSGEHVDDGVELVARVGGGKVPVAIQEVEGEVLADGTSDELKEAVGGLAEAVEFEDVGDVGEGLAEVVLVGADSSGGSTVACHEMVAGPQRSSSRPILMPMPPMASSWMIQTRVHHGRLSSFCNAWVERWLRRLSFS